MEVDFNQHVLQSFGASGRILEELSDYCGHTYENAQVKSFVGLNDLPQINSYRRYEKESRSKGVIETLSQYLVQLQFPIQKGISHTKRYKDVTLRGKPKDEGIEIDLQNPNSIKLEVYCDDLVGNVPIVQVPNKSDFSKIICALTNKNEPKEIPASMGAAFIKGLNNWGRINELKQDWKAKSIGESWESEFKQNILPNRELYQDQLIVVSEQPYSNVSGQKFNIDDKTWMNYSMSIRKAHECAHLFTFLQYGKIGNHVFDELIADYVGITHALGRFDLNWFLHFMGLESLSGYREGGRFQNYVTELSFSAAKVLQRVLIQAARNLSDFDSNLLKSGDAICRKSSVMAICETGLLRLAHTDGTSALIDKYESIRRGLTISSQ